MSADPMLGLPVDEATSGAQGLVRAAPGRRREVATARRVARLLRDDRALGVVSALTDEVMRARDPQQAARLLRAAAEGARRPGFSLVDLVGLRAAAGLSVSAPETALRLVRRRVRALTSGLILDAEPGALRGHLARRRAQGLGVTVNVVGEAVLGEAQADQHLAHVVATMALEGVTHVAVKLSSVVSQLTTIDHDGSQLRVASRLRSLFEAGLRHGVTITLDMEEFRDLRLTLDAFCAVLDEPRFSSVEAGIVLQAYLPESAAALDELAAWAQRRHARTGAGAKVRLVKGANLAMERVEAELHGWVPAPLGSKAEVDANYAALLDGAIGPERAPFLRVGVASHNLFDVSLALELARQRGVPAQVDVEMLEGMAPGAAAALAAAGHRVLLYAPVVDDDDFESAIAYLARRFDENTAPDNYLRSAFSIAEDPRTFERERERFVASVAQRRDVDTRRRRGPRPRPASWANAPDGDPTDPSYVGAVRAALDAVLADDDRVLAGGTGEGPWVQGRDPSSGHHWLRYRAATVADVDVRVARARQAASRWAARRPEERRRLLEAAADAVEAQRASLIALMAREGGKTVAEGDPEVSEGVDYLRYYAATAPGGGEPLGVVAVVPPWNFPVAIPLGGVAAALAAGSAAILKPAPEAVAAGAALVEILQGAGLDPDLVSLVLARDDEAGRHLITHEDVDAVILTGSFDTAVLFTRWRPEINLLAETSGKNAMIVTAAADLDAAVRDLVHSAFSHAGQKCSAASLAIVDRATAASPRFWAQLVDAVSSLRVGAAYDLGTTVGPVIRAPEAALARALQLDPGERWVVEPRRLEGAGELYRPGVKAGIAPGSWSHLNEWFGPVLGVMEAPDLATAIAWQNAIPYGLTGGLHSLDTLECEQWLERVAVGNAYLNRGITGAVVGRQPFGGWRRSSVGPTAKAGGRNYLAALRRWPELGDVDAAVDSLEQWFDREGAPVIEIGGLASERNLQRYRRHAAPIVVRLDPDIDATHLRWLRALTARLGLLVEYSASAPVLEAPGATVEAVADLVARLGGVSRVRWLSREVPPTADIVGAGITLDRRPLAQEGAIEGPRWLLEQSLALTSHRFGTLGAGPQPRCSGLAP